MIQILPVRSGLENVEEQSCEGHIDFNSYNLYCFIWFVVI